MEALIVPLFRSRKHRMRLKTSNGGNVVSVSNKQKNETAKTQKSQRSRVWEVGRDRTRRCRTERLRQGSVPNVTRRERTIVPSPDPTQPAVRTCALFAETTVCSAIPWRRTILVDKLFYRHRLTCYVRIYVWKI